MSRGTKEPGGAIDPDAQGDRPRRKLADPILLVPVVVALAALFVCLGGGRLSDDWLANFLLDHASDTPSVRWAEAFADFGRPWLGVEGSPLYRPLVSVSYAFDLTLGGGAAWASHLTNLCLHLGTTLATAWLCFLLCPAWPRVAALCGGCLFALHPAAVEPVAWIAGRTSCLETFFRLGAMTAFAAHLATRRKRGFILAYLFAACALSTKGSAVVLPLSFLAVDLCYARGLAEHGDGRRALLRRQLAFVPLWVGYGLCRILALGELVGRTVEAGESPGLLAGIPAKLAFCLAALPDPREPAFFALCLLALAAIVSGLSRARVLLVLALVWLCAHFLPSWQVMVQEGGSGGRIVYAATASLALLLCWFGLECGRRPRVFAAAFALALPLVALSGQRHLRAYEIGWGRIARLQTVLVEQATLASVEAPLAPLVTPSAEAGVPLLNVDALFPLVERPTAADDHPLVALGFVLVEVDGSQDLFLDASPIRALWRQGARVLSWNEHVGAFGVLPPPRDAPLPALVRDPTDPQRYVFEGGAVSPLDIEGLRVTLGPGAGRIRVRWLADTPRSWRELALESGGATELVVDLTHDERFFAHHLNPRTDWIRGFEVADAELGGIVALGRLPELALDRRLADAFVTLGAEGGALVAPASEDPLRVVLCGPDAGRAFEVEPGRPLRFPDRVRRRLAKVLRSSRQKRFYYWFERGGTSPARSAVDWFRLHPEEASKAGRGL